MCFASARDARGLLSTFAISSLNVCMLHVQTVKLEGEYSTPSKCIIENRSVVHLSTPISLG